MRFFLMLFVLLLALVFETKGQAIDIGARGGFNLYTMFGDTYSDLGFRPGQVLGVYGRTALKGGKYDGQVELNYSQEGAKNGNFDFSSFSTVVYSQVIAYNYLNIPAFIIGSLD